MSSSTVSRYRESTTITTSPQTYDRVDTSFAEEDALDAIAKEAELRLHNQREQNRVARQLRHKELERNAPDDNEEESPTTSHTPSTPLGSSKSGVVGTNANSLLLQKFLNGDVDLRTIEQRDLRRLLSELESRYKSLMISNSGMYNEKQALYYQVDLHKDQLEELYETTNQLKRQYKEKCREFDWQKRSLSDLQHESNQIKEVLMKCERLIEECEEQRFSSVLPTEIKSRKTLLLLNSFANGSIDQKLERILHEKCEEYEELMKLRSELDEEKTRSKKVNEFRINLNESPNDTCDSEQQKQLIKEITSLKNRLQRLDTDNGSLQQENKRYEAQLARYKQQLDDAERVEDELKYERRALQRELRMARDELEQERTRSDVLQRENERLRTSRKKNLLGNSDDPLVSSRSHSPSLPTNSNSPRDEWN
ncbi:unnamed protein product [Adineta ricciae]|uniref:Uncharacterized protein n=1 Tax=Adineta ricciae TaxID=249248 RepID=A0A813ZWN9_ADIRI|nr:unnamed protein product [Adineta ricciae]